MHHKLCSWYRRNLFFDSQLLECMHGKSIASNGFLFKPLITTMSAIIFVNIGTIDIVFCSSLNFWPICKLRRNWVISINKWTFFITLWLFFKIFTTDNEELDITKAARRKLRAEIGCSGTKSTATTNGRNGVIWPHPIAPSFYMVPVSW